MKRDGHLRQRGRSIEVRVYGGKGKTVTRQVRWQGDERTTREVAERELARLLEEVAERGYVQTPQATFATLAEDWYAEGCRNWSPSTAAAHRHRLNRQILPALGDVRLRQLTPARVAEWLRTVDAAPATRHKLFLMVRSALAHGVRMGWLARNPADKVTPPSVPPPVVDAPDERAVATLLAAAEKYDEDLYAWLRLSVVTGARRGEVAGIQWRDIDGQTLTIRRSVVLGDDGKVHVRPWPKGKRPRRITLDDETLALLAALHDRNEKAARVCHARLPASGFVFATEVDGSAPWRPDRATQAFGRLRARVGLRHVRLHDLRHFVATRLLDAGYAVADVAARLGHANGTTTTRLYAHAIPARDADLAATMAAIVRHDP